jgi:hypothetical protein
MMIKFSQPSDYRFKGREIWVNPEDVALITTSDYTDYGQCIVKMRDGEAFTVQGGKDEIAKQVNNAIANHQP